MVHVCVYYWSYDSSFNCRLHDGGVVHVVGNYSFDHRLGYEGKKEMSKCEELLLVSTIICIIAFSGLLLTGHGPYVALQGDWTEQEEMLIANTMILILQKMVIASTVSVLIGFGVYSTYIRLKSKGARKH